MCRENRATPGQHQDRQLCHFSGGEGLAGVKGRAELGRGAGPGWGDSWREQSSRARQSGQQRSGRGAGARARPPPPPVVTFPRAHCPNSKLPTRPWRTSVSNS